MPIYEYRCGGCGKRVSILTLRASEQIEAVCDRCGSAKLTRMMSRFAMVRSEDSRLESLSDPGQLRDLDEKDPKSMARWMKRMGRELGEEFGGNELDEMVDDVERASHGDDSAGGEAGEVEGGDAGTDDLD